MEERILEELAWNANSPLWKELTTSGYTIPKSHEFAQDNFTGKFKNSLSFFFKKVNFRNVSLVNNFRFLVYHLATIRIMDLCERVRMEEHGRTRVWTLFEVYKII